MDRNDLPDCVFFLRDVSLSARRAWIEMFSALGLSWYIRSLSARRAWIRIDKLSLSARRAWIEMFSVREVFANFEVALRKESVDRNFW